MRWRVYRGPPTVLWATKVSLMCPPYKEETADWGGSPKASRISGVQRLLSIGVCVLSVFEVYWVKPGICFKTREMPVFLFRAGGFSEF